MEARNQVLWTSDSLEKTSLGKEKMVILKGINATYKQCLNKKQLSYCSSTVELNLKLFQTYFFLTKSGDRTSCKIHHKTRGLNGVMNSICLLFTFSKASVNSSKLLLWNLANFLSKHLITFYSILLFKEKNLWSSVPDVQLQLFIHFLNELQRMLHQCSNTQ